MATKKTKSTTKKNNDSLQELRKKYALTRVNIKAGKEKNTNAHKSIKKQIARKLTNQPINKKDQTK